MFDALRSRLLSLLRIPQEPEPPVGAAGSARVFRAGRNYIKILLVRWGVAQVGAFIGLLLSLYFVSQLYQQIEFARNAPRPVSRPAVITPAGAQPPAAITPAPAPATPPAESAKPAPRKNRSSPDNLIRFLAERIPAWALVLLVAAEIIGVVLFLIQFVATFVAVRLGYDQHWYIVTDRSLRIRTGLLRVQESTMSFANLQQVDVSQGPLQRLLGLADVRVQSAGGGGHSSEDAASGAADSLHTGVFHGVANAPEIRDLILERLRQFRAAGLGDPDDPNTTPRPPATPAPADTLLAARELLAEATALRRALAG